MIYGNRTLLNKKDILAHTPWRSVRSIERAYKEGFPFEWIEGRRMHDPNEVAKWFKRRSHNDKKTA